MASFEDFYNSLYRVSKGPKYEFWHPEFFHKNEDDDKYIVYIWNACHTWEEKTCESMMKSLGKTPYIWGLRNQTRKMILDMFGPDDRKEYEKNAPLPYLHGICPERANKFELDTLFQSMLALSDSVFGNFKDMPQREREYEKMLVNHYHWIFPHSTMAMKVRERLRKEARRKFREVTGEEYGSVLPVDWSTDNNWIPYNISRPFTILKNY